MTPEQKARELVDDFLHGGDLAMAPEDIVEMIAVALAEASRKGRGSVSEWQPIETAPKDSSWFLGRMENGRQAVVRWGDGCWEDDARLCRDPYHWMPCYPFTQANSGRPESQDVPCGKVVYDNESQRHECIVKGAHVQHQYVASDEFPLDDVPDESSLRPDPELANAQLIVTAVNAYSPDREAAMKELIEAAENIASTIDGCVSDFRQMFCGDIEHPEDCECRYERLRAALAKMKEQQ